MTIFIQTGEPPQETAKLYFRPNTQLAVVGHMTATVARRTHQQLPWQFSQWTKC